MMRMRTKTSAAFVPMKETKPSSPAADLGSEWEVRPGGMLVQKRNPDSDAAVSVPAPTILVRVKYGSAHHEIPISSQATFGELKKLLSAQTGLHHQDQKLVFKDKERESTAYLDMAGVKDRSKIVLLEDPASQAKRFLEMRRNAKMEKASKSISEISLEVDKLATQVSGLESIISKGGKVAENDVINLIELLMSQLIKLDGIIVDGDVKLQRRMQVRRVQKYVETLDVLKIRNAMPKNIVHQQHQQQKQSQTKRSQPSVVVTPKWETFDSLFSPSTSTTTTATATSTTTTTSSTPTPRYDWELF